jgi:hypothetical protein
MIRQDWKPLLAAAALVATLGLTTATWADDPAPTPAAVCPVAPATPSASPTTAPASDAVCPANEGRKLPAGHPALGAAAATAAPAVAIPGSIDLKVVQGTQGAPAIGTLPVTIQLFQEGTPTQKFDVKLDANGHAFIPNVPVRGTIEPVVTIEHAGLTQQTVGAALDAKNPKAQIQMSVYETAATAPAWTIAMRHVLVHATPEALQVTEMLSVSNPTDRIWLGATHGTDAHVTLALPLPLGITNLELAGGFQDPYAKQQGDEVISTLPMFPGAMQFQVNYSVPITNGTAQWTIAAPATVEQLIVFAPADQSTVTVSGAQDNGKVDMGQGPMHMFRGSDIKAGRTVTLSFSGLATATAAATPAAASPASVNWVRNIGAIGAIVVVVLGSAILLIKRPTGAKKA